MSEGSSKYKYKLIELKNIKNKCADKINFDPKLDYNKITAYNYILILKPLRGSNYKLASNLNNYPKDLHKLNNYLYKFMPEIDKVFKNYNFNIDILKKTDFAVGYSLEFLPYISYLINNTKKSKVLEITDAYFLKNRLELYNSNNTINPKLIFIESKTNSYKEEYKNQVKLKYKDYLLSNKVDNAIKTRFKEYKAEWNSFDMIFGHSEFWKNVVLMNAGFNVNIINYIKVSAIAFRFLKKGGDFQIMLDIGLSTKATLDLFDIIGKFFENYKIHNYTPCALPRYPIDLIGFKGISEPELEKLFQLYEDLLPYQVNINYLINYNAGIKIGNINKKKISRLKGIAQLKNDTHHTKLSRDVNNYMDYATIKQVQYIEYIYNLFYPYQDKLDNEEYLKNIYEPFILEQYILYINLYKKYKIPFNDFLMKVQEKYISKVLTTLYE